jgi:hypothetical protein
VDVRQLGITIIVISQKMTHNTRKNKESGVHTQKESLRLARHATWMSENKSCRILFRALGRSGRKKDNVGNGKEGRNS